MLTALEIRTLNRYTYHPLDQRMCSECLVVYQGIRENFHIKKYYPDGTVGFNVKCAECFNKTNQKRTAKYRTDPHQFITARVSGFKARAKEIGVAFDLTAEELIAQWDRQNGHCFYSNEPIAFSNTTETRKAPHRLMASLDRMNPDKGYVIGNVVWCSYVINRMKNDLSYADFLVMCGLIFKTRKQYD